jgi:hypothetical protein
MAPSTYPFPRYSCQFSVAGFQSVVLMPVSENWRLRTVGCFQG